MFCGLLGNNEHYCEERFITLCCWFIIKNKYPKYRGDPSGDMT